MRRRILAVAYFGLWLAAGHLVVLYGRYLFRRILAEGDPATTSPPGALALLVLVLSCVVYGITREVALGMQSKVLTGLVAVSLHDFLQRRMQKEFWNLLFDYMAKMIQYFLVLLVGGAAVLRYIYPEGRQHEFRADLFYSGIAVVFSFMFILYWVMVPAWVRLVEGYSVEDQTSP